jgi:hypothetical protein
MPRKPFTTFQKEIAFDVYYAMGEQRDLKRVAKVLQGNDNFLDGAPAWKTLQNWSSQNNWQERCELRDIENSRKVQDKTDREVVNTKADYRKMIKERLSELRTEKGYLTNAYATAKAKLEDPKNKELDVTSIKELTELSKAMAALYREERELMKLDLLLMGEADSHQKQSGEVVFYFGDKIEPGDV